ncbi:uncharacterized protein E5676_scaffold328G00280 [Cucumis melo var. makuwa]|uniref:Asp_protease_2 domain-containing protein n=1 Tax=Cucumis melo var. makuwa TaxID=1194695 RepID=A0A5A7VGN7_CUCMM|nr:uncharacterized protein E6C27_scaffold21G003800 [Cucumis melo var. makuwa]TYK00960.1 uncharacterized protein E5676_scaffold602G001370 [Cucumis melo var. makuwa]TYK21001.1 uncharacterized protein E5676_scaffold328G00280 [Cucumis melo var. makuwa]
MIDSGATHNFITEAEARRLRLRWEKDSGIMKAVNSVALPIVGLVKQATIKLGGWKGRVDFVVVKMDDFDVVLEMEFLLEHQVIPMPSASCIVITGSFPTTVQAEIRQPNGFKMISTMRLDENRAQGEPPFVEIPLGASEKSRETVPKDTLCVPETKAHVKDAYRMAPPELAKLRKPSKMLVNTGCSRPVQAPYEAHVLSLKKKDRSPQQCVDCRTQSKLTVWRKCPLPMLTGRVDCLRGVKLPKSDDRPRQCRVRTAKAKGLEKNCVTRHEAYEFPVVLLSLTDAKGGKCCSVQSQMSALSHVRECHQGGSLREEDSQWSENRERQVALNGSKQAMIEGPSLGIVDATKTPEVEAEQFSCVLGEYLHHCVDCRQKNWVQLLKVAQFGHSAQTDSPSKRSPFEIKGKRHPVLSPLADGPYVGGRPQVHRVEEEWEQMADIARVRLEASRPMEEGVDRERCPLESEWKTKLPFNGATMSYDHLSTWTWRKTENSSKPLLIE